MKSQLGCRFALEPRSVGSYLLTSDDWNPGLPNEIEVGAFNRRERLAPDHPWMPILTERGRFLRVGWPGYQFVLAKESCEHFTWGGTHTLNGLMRDLTRIPFTVATVDDWLSGVLSQRHDMKVESQIDPGRSYLGMLAAFRGPVGHRRVVSRRWLEHGPWCLLRDERQDLSVVLFHDPDLDDPAAVLAQSVPGHHLLGWAPHGGYMPEVYRGDTYDLAGTTLLRERRHAILVIDREVSQLEMLEAAVFRRNSLATPQPLDAVAFVFLDEDNARRHLHDLWLRGLECRVIRAGREVRLDLDYAPTPTPPAWVGPVRAKWEPLLQSFPTP